MLIRDALVSSHSGFVTIDRMQIASLLALAPSKLASRLPARWA